MSIILGNRFPQAPRMSSSASEKIMHLILVTNSARGLISIPTASRPNARASTRLVPPPDVRVQHEVAVGEGLDNGARESR